MSGLEENKRRLLSPILYDESNANFANLGTIRMTLPEIGIGLIKNVLSEVFNQFHYFVSDYPLINLVLYITITIDRVQD